MGLIELDVIEACQLHFQILRERELDPNIYFIQIIKLHYKHHMYECLRWLWLKNYHIINLKISVKLQAKKLLRNNLHIIKFYYIFIMKNYYQSMVITYLCLNVIYYKNKLFIHKKILYFFIITHL